jgi:hypothetical protein
MKLQFDPEIWLVERKPFNPAQWLQQRAPTKQAAPRSKAKAATTIENEVEVIVRRIEAHQIDLTCSYEDWLKLGFAFTEMGEAGRGYFHRISRFNGGYDFAHCNRQFDKCLKGRKTGITLKSFFAAAHDAGVNVKV